MVVPPNLGRIAQKLKLDKSGQLIKIDKMDEYSFSSHLILDLYGCGNENLADVSYISDFLHSFIGTITNLKGKLKPAHVFKYHGEKKDEWGVSGVIMTDKCHISIHTFPEKKHVFVDIFSAQEFDTDFARRDLIKIFSAQEFESNLTDDNFQPGLAQQKSKELVGQMASF